jgi:hypothetical protein
MYVHILTLVHKAECCGATIYSLQFELAFKMYIIEVYLKDYSPP